MKYYTHYQFVLTVITVCLLFYFTIPYVLEEGAHYERRERMMKPDDTSKMIERTLKETKKQTKGKQQYVASTKPEAGIHRVSVEKSWDDYFGMFLQIVQALSPLSTMITSFVLWKRKRREA